MLKRSDFFKYQDQAYAYIMSRKRSALWIDMGLGKTAPTLTAVAQLLREWAVVKVLIVGPKRVVQSTWPDEAQAWEHLQHLTFVDLSGGRENMLAGLKKKGDIYTINVEMLHELVEHFKTKWPFDMVVIDESSKFKTPSSKRFRALRRLVKRDLIEYLIELTGTPAPNGLLDIWSQFYLLDKGEALGSTFTAYQRTYFTRDFMGYNYELNPGAEERIYERIGDKALVIKGSNTEPVINNKITVTLSEKAMNQYLEMEKEMFLEIATGVDVEAGSRAVLGNKLQQIASGAVYFVDEVTEQRKVQYLHTEKLDALESIVEEAGGKPILVGYAFKHERDAILKKFKFAEEVDDDPETIRRWNRGEIRMLVGHPASMGHGLNLQHGGHIAVWYGLTWSLELYMQFSKRLDRTGQKNRVIIHHLICKGTVDEDIYAVLPQKDARQTALTNAVLNRMKRVLQET